MEGADLASTPSSALFIWDFVQASTMMAIQAHNLCFVP